MRNCLLDLKPFILFQEISIMSKEQKSNKEKKKKPLMTAKEKKAAKKLKENPKKGSLI
jgi:hypothetical protein